MNFRTSLWWRKNHKADFKKSQFPILQCQILKNFLQGFLKISQLPRNFSRGGQFVQRRHSTAQCSLPKKTYVHVRTVRQGQSWLIASCVVTTQFSKQKFGGGYPPIVGTCCSGRQNCIKIGIKQQQKLKKKHLGNFSEGTCKSFLDYTKTS